MIEGYVSERYPEVEFDSVTDRLVSFLTDTGFMKGLNLLGLTIPEEIHAIKLPYKPNIAYTALVKFIPVDKDIVITASNYTVTYGQHQAIANSPDDAERTLETFKQIENA
jgi:hypothetical protein